MASQSTRGPMRVVRIVIRSIFAGFFVLVFGTFGWFVCFPFGEVTYEYADLPGRDAIHHDAISRQENEWIEGVAPDEVRSMSRKYASTIDSHSKWFRIQLPPSAAAAWQDGIHA